MHYNKDWNMYNIYVDNKVKIIWLYKGTDCGVGRSLLHILKLGTNYHERIYLKIQHFLHEFLWSFNFYTFVTFNKIVIRTVWILLYLNKTHLFSLKTTTLNTELTTITRMHNTCGNDKYLAEDIWMICNDTECKSNYCDINWDKLLQYFIIG